MKTYNVHYPDGSIKRHELEYNHQYLPDLDKCFYCNYTDYDGFFIIYSIYMQVSEMNDEDIWTEEISKERYMEIMYDSGIPGSFISFKMTPRNSLIEIQ